MVDCIAQQMGQRRFELFQHIAVDLGLFTVYLQTHLLAQRAAQVSHHTALAGKHIGKRAHAAGQGCVVQQLRALAGLPAEFVKVGGLLLQDVLGFHQQPLRLGQCFQHRQALAAAFQLGLQAIEGAHALAVHALEALQGGQIGFEALGLDQRLARQVEQAVEPIGGYPQYPLAALRSALGSLARHGRLCFGLKLGGNQIDRG
ncbi:hypothetical protein D3C76_1291590 [compost metagenome]